MEMSQVYQVSTYAHIETISTLFSGCMQISKPAAVFLNQILKFRNFSARDEDV